jgi:type II restriction enzyme
MDRIKRIKRLIATIPKLSDYRLELVNTIVDIFQQPKDFSVSLRSDIFSSAIVDDLGDILRLHHCFSREPFSKDKFEYALENVLQIAGISTHLAPRGQRGYDITIDGKRVSLKTEAAAAIRTNTIHISKFMELGSGEWGDNPKDLIGLRDQFLKTLSSFDRILMLRALRKGEPDYLYELIEIPMSLLHEAKNGVLKMKLDSTQYPKPGYCYIGEEQNPKYSLYFDGGGERKLQIKQLRKTYCILHASWIFDPPKKI